MTSTHDPYLNTVKRSLTEKKNKIRKEKIKEIEEEPQAFLSKNILISDYIYLPESLQKIFLLTLFIGLPYFFGIIVLFIILSYAAFKEYANLTFDLFMFSWTVGYESIAFILLILILKNAFTFRKR